MHPARPYRRLAAVAALTILSSFPARAQRAAATAASTRTPATAVAARPLKVLGLADVAEWKRITGTAISPDGKWMTYTYQPNEGDGTLYVKQLDGATVYSGSTGAAASGGRGGGGGGRAVFRRLPVARLHRERPDASRGARWSGTWWTRRRAGRRSR